MTFYRLKWTGHNKSKAHTKKKIAKNGPIDAPFFDRKNLDNKYKQSLGQIYTKTYVRLCL